VQTERILEQGESAGDFFHRNASSLQELALVLRKLSVMERRFSPM
jgi:hypothetical protein